ncbi:MAG TPA: hypothetical protein VF746_03865 [Longimicrobium sp.]|jgi:hypothetical protein
MGGSWSGIVWAGFIASVLAACVFWLFRAMDWTRFSPTSQLGCLFFDDPRLPMAETVGFAIFLALGATVAAAAGAGAMRVLGGAGWATGAAAGALAGLLAAAALPWLAKASRCVRMGRLPPPGHLGLGWGRATPVALVAGSTVYGGILGAVLAAL